MSDSSSLIPIGTIVASVLTAKSIPTGWLPCDGSAIPAAYQELRTLLNANVTPNLIGRVLIGAGTLTSALAKQTDGRIPNFAALNSTGVLQIGDTGGECTHTLLTAEMPQHSHPINGGDFGIHHRSFKGDDDNDCPFETSSDTRLGGTDNAGSSAPHYNVEPYYAVTYIIYAGSV